MERKLKLSQLKRAKLMYDYYQQEVNCLESECEHSTCTSQSYYTRIDRQISRLQKAHTKVYAIISALETQLERMC
jgi:C-terminal processing protease CtpA/Prc